jgi:hypothetical protein
MTADALSMAGLAFHGPGGNLLAALKIGYLD